MSMIPGLHPNTRPQRKGEQGAWALAARDEFEARDAPARWVAVGLAGIMALMLLSVAGALAFVGANRPRIPLPAEAAKQRPLSAGARRLPDGCGGTFACAQNFFVSVRVTNRPNALASPGSKPYWMFTNGALRSKMLVPSRLMLVPFSTPPSFWKS